jgi:hypothetical protein
MNYYCPNCSEVIHDRTRKICGVCGTALPREVLMCLAKAETLSKEADIAEGAKRDRVRVEAGEQKPSDGGGLLS